MTFSGSRSRDDEGEPLTVGIRLSESEFTDQCDAAMRAADELPAVYAAVRKLHDELANDGFPTRSGGGEGGPSNITHEFDEACPDCGGRAPEPLTIPCSRCKGTGKLLLSVPQHSDPVGELVAAGPSREPWSAALNGAAADVQAAVKALDSARGKLLRAKVRPPEPADTSVSAAWCFNCARYRRDGDAILTGTYRIGPEPGDGSPARSRCRHCYDWRRDAELVRSGTHPTIVVDPAWPLEQPGVLVMQRERGARVSVADVEAAVDGVKRAAVQVGRQGAEAATR